MVSSRVPDRLTVITYVSQYYYFFNKEPHASPASLRSSHVTSPTSLTKSKTSLDDLNRPKISSDERSRREDHLSSSKTHSICALCREPVHLVQRHLIDGQIYHRSCFRCKVCRSTLLPGSYKQGSDAGSLICTHHTTDSKDTRVDLSQQIESTEHLPKFKCRQTALSFGGFTHPPYYTEKTESQDKRVETEGRDRNTRQEVKGRDTDSTLGSKGKVKRLVLPHPPPPRFKEGATEGAGKPAPSPAQAATKLQEDETKTQGPSGLPPASPCVAVSGGSKGPVPAPRRTLDSPAAPVPAPRTKKLQRMNSSSATGTSPNQRKPSASSPRVTSPTSGGHKVKTNHPWMGIVHPGPWTQLPPAPAPTTPPRSSSVPAMQGRWLRRRVPPPNPFGDEMDDETEASASEKVTKIEAANQMKPSKATSRSENEGNLPNDSGATRAPVTSSDSGNAAAKSKPEDKAKPPDKPDLSKKPAVKDPSPPTVDSDQRDRSAASSRTCSGRESSDGGANKLEEPGVSGAPSVAKDNLSGAGSILVVSDLAGATSVPNEPGVPGKAGQASGLGAPHRAEAAPEHEAPDLAEASRTEARGADFEFGAAYLTEEDAAAGLCLADMTKAGAVGGLAMAAGGPTTFDAAQSHPLPTSVSVPVLTSPSPQHSSMLTDLTEGNESVQVSPSQAKACRQNPFDKKPVMPKSKTFQALSSRRAPAPGYGFPLVKRKVQTDRCLSVDDLQAEMGKLDKHLETLELRGVELERNLRQCKNEKEEEVMLMDWFSLIHEKHVLVRRDVELVYLKKQQSLEERQADVEYQLRCLLNKPEAEWSQEDRGREQQLMDELVTIIEQRNQIISSLDQDRQREKEEDLLLETMMKRKDFQKEGLKELKKSKGKFKPLKVFKMLSHKPESTRESKDKKS
ncbi:MICAL-like protein 1 isoform X2 [Myripristis murdjan]|nr:MICAL-like protein 1 isoform X2 [Myripristis murdjan]